MKTPDRFDRLLKPMVEGVPPNEKSLPTEQETSNPAPDKDYSDKQQPFTDGEENDPEIEEE